MLRDHNCVKNLASKIQKIGKRKFMYTISVKNVVYLGRHIYLQLSKKIHIHARIDIFYAKKKNIDFFACRFFIKTMNIFTPYRLGVKFSGNSDSQKVRLEHMNFQVYFSVCLKAFMGFRVQNIVI